MDSVKSSATALGLHDYETIIDRVKVPAIILFAILCAFLLRSTVNRIRTAYFTTLSDIPGPWYARFTRLRLAASDLAGTRWFYVQGLHKKYGSTVRIAPHEVAISDPKDVTQVHAVGTEFRKRQVPGTPFNIFSIGDPKLHRNRQRFYAKAFSDENLKTEVEPNIQYFVKTAIANIKQDAKRTKNRVVDAYKWSMLFSGDVVLDLVFGDAKTNGLMAQKNPDVEAMITGAYLQRMLAWINFCFPIFLLGRILSPIIPPLKDIFVVEWRYQDFVQKTQRQRDIARRTTFVRDTKCPEKDGVFTVSENMKLTETDIAHDIQTLLGAGGEPVGNNLAYLLWAVLKDPSLQAELEAEVAGLTEPIDNAKTAELPVLNAVIMESLRLYGGGVTQLPRFAPNAVQFGDYIVPPGVQVTTHHGALHRNPSAWENPEAFDHTRWLSPKQSKALIQDKFQPFSAGTRQCLAIHMVMIELRVFVATFFRDCRGAKLAPSTTDASMRVLDRFHIMPVTKTFEIVLAN